MADEFTVERFLPHVGEVFHIDVGDGRELPILLSEITRLASDGDRRRTRQPFSLIFHAPRNVWLDQQVYRLLNPGMEPFECFLVPITPDQNGMRFEAIYT
jgi:hypothetical protein